MEGFELSQDLQPEKIRAGHLLARPAPVIDLGKQVRSLALDRFDLRGALAVFHGAQRRPAGLLHLANGRIIGPSARVVDDDFAHHLVVLARGSEIRRRHIAILRPLRRKWCACLP